MTKSHKKQEKVHELLKCCGEYPRYDNSGDLWYVYCRKCGNRTPSYITGGLTANINWNEMRERQLVVEKLRGRRTAKE